MSCSSTILALLEEARISGIYAARISGTGIIGNIRLFTFPEGRVKHHLETLETLRGTISDSDRQIVHDNSLPDVDSVVLLVLSKGTVYEDLVGSFRTKFDFPDAGVRRIQIVLMILIAIMTIMDAWASGYTVMSSRRLCRMQAGP